MTNERPIDRAGPVLLGALAPVTFLLVDPAGWYPFGPVKWMAVSVLGLAGVALVVAHRPVSVSRWLGWAITAWLGWLAIAAAVGLDPTYAWIGTPERHLGVVTWILCALLLLAGAALSRPDEFWPGIYVAGDADPGPERVAPVLVGLTVGGLGVGGVATAEALGWEPAVLDVGTRLTGTFGSAAYLGAATALLLPICVGVATDTAVPRRLRLGAAAASPLLLVACIGSGARAAWFGLVVAAVVTAWVQRAWLAARRSVVRRSGAALAVAAIAILLLTPAGARLSSLADEDAPGGQGRLDEWRIATRVFADHLVTGVGPEGYRIAFASGVDPDYERSHGRDQQPDRAHSGPLDVALSAGIPGLVGWLAVVVLVGRHVLRALHGRSPWLVGLAAGLLAHWSAQLVLFPVAELEPIVWLLAGVVVVSAEPVRAQARGPGPSRVRAWCGASPRPPPPSPGSWPSSPGSPRWARTGGPATPPTRSRVATTSPPPALRWTPSSSDPTSCACTCSRPPPASPTNRAPWRASTSSTTPSPSRLVTRSSSWRAPGCSSTEPPPRWCPPTSTSPAGSSTDCSSATPTTPPCGDRPLGSRWSRATTSVLAPPTDGPTRSRPWGERRWGRGWTRPASAAALRTLVASPVGSAPEAARPDGTDRDPGASMGMHLTATALAPGAAGGREPRAPAPPTIDLREGAMTDEGPRSFDAFYTGARPNIARALALALGDVDLATEATDEALARAYERWPTVGRLDRPEGWVYRVAMNWALSILRRRRRGDHRLYDPGADTSAVSDPDVHAALAELDVKHRSVIVCRHLLGWSVADTAAALNVREGTVKSRLHRAHRILQSRLHHLRTPEELS